MSSFLASIHSRLEVAAPEVYTFKELTFGQCKTTTDVKAMVKRLSRNAIVVKTFLDENRMPAAKVSVPMTELKSFVTKYADGDRHSMDKVIEFNPKIAKYIK